MQTLVVYGDCAYARLILQMKPSSGKPAEAPGGGSGLASRLASLSRWRRAFLAIGLGAISAAALPPLHLIFLLVPAFVGLLWLLDGVRCWRGAFLVGWCFGAGHFFFGLYWVVLSFFVDAARFGWMAPFALAALAFGFGLFPAFVAVAVRTIGASSGIGGRVLILAVSWAAVEWVRGWLFTGFPWNLVATAWTFSDAMIQSTALIGSYGLGLITVAIAATPAVLGADGPRSGRVRLAAAGAVLVLLWGGGAWRLGGAETETVPDVRLRIVQPNVPQREKWQDGLRQKNFIAALRMSIAPHGGAPESDAWHPTHVIWPETAVAFFLADSPALLAAMAKVTPPGGQIITGAPRRSAQGEGEYRVWNSVHAVDDKGRVVATYDKAHLVPFGEYVPFRGILNFSKLTTGGTDFSPGPGITTLDLPGLPPFSPLICYEVIFPGKVVSGEAGERPQWLLNLTNDAWFGVSSGPYQHLASARLRAVEEGLPLARSANTGVSAIIDAYGRVQQRLELGVEGVIDAALPKSLSAPPPYARLGDWILLVIGVITLVPILRRRSQT
ncbi:MAG: apolipoprotein N-acyltransferase [Rhodospirillales bacterium]|nr:apolipoprotein N-acyltransferase [Rhodospirillales bacterium]